jgi:hypothetical protein
MPRLGVPSPTDSARVIADVCGEPAPLPRSTNPRHNDRPGGTFPRVVQPLDRDLGKGTKGRRMGPSAGAKTPRSSGRAMAAVSCPAPDFKACKLCFHANADIHGGTRETIDFSKLPSRAPEDRGRTFRGFVDEGHGRGQAPERARSRDHARPRRNPQDMRRPRCRGGKSLCGGTFMEIAPTASGAHRPQHPCPAQSRGRAAQIIPRKLTVLPRIGAS